MRNLTSTLCLTLAVLLGSAGTSWGAAFNKGVAAYDSFDFATALREWTPLAEQGNALAQFRLGWMYVTGQGVLQDDKTGVKWYTFAAEQGNADAQYSLGVMYVLGKGILQDDVYAHMWWNIAASNGYEDGSKMRDMYAKTMTPTQIEKAQDLARECIRKKYKEC